MVPEWVLYGASERAVVLYCHLHRLANQDSRCWPKRRTIAEALGWSVDKVDRTMVELEALGAVAVEERRHEDGGQASNLYTVWFDSPEMRTGSRGIAARGRRDSAAPKKDSQLEPQPSLAADAARKVRTPDPLWDAVADVCGLTAPFTKSAAGQIAVAVKELRAVEATPVEVRLRAGQYRAHFPEARLTPTALAKHWPGLVSKVLTVDAPTHCGLCGWSTGMDEPHVRVHAEWVAGT